MWGWPLIYERFVIVKARTVEALGTSGGDVAREACGRTTSPKDLDGRNNQGTRCKLELLGYEMEMARRIDP